MQKLMIITAVFFLFGCGESEQEKESRLQKEFDNCVQSAKDFAKKMCDADKECENKYYTDYRKSCLIERYGCAAVTGSTSC